MIEAATAYLLPVSAREIRGRIEETLALAEETGAYEPFREAYYARHLYPTISDSRETVPATLALFRLAGGDPERAILYGANFGRDADTIATMVGGLAGALHGVQGLPAGWVSKVESNPDVRYGELVGGLADIVRQRAGRAEAVRGDAQLTRLRPGRAGTSAASSPAAGAGGVAGGGRLGLLGGDVGRRRGLGDAGRRPRGHRHQLSGQHVHLVRPPPRYGRRGRVRRGRWLEGRRALAEGAPFGAGGYWRGPFSGQARRESPAALAPGRGVAGQGGRPNCWGRRRRATIVRRSWSGGVAVSSEVSPITSSQRER